MPGRARVVVVGAGLAGLTVVCALRGLPVAMLVRHFERLGTEWQLRAEIRRMVEFRSINLAQRIPEMGTFDVIFLRNVLIHFDADPKRGTFAQVTRLLRPGASLFLGSS